MIEFIDGPCSWSQLAPARLRHKATGGVSAGWNYSTARHTDGLHPIVLHTFDIVDSPLESTVKIELLPEAIRRRWRDVGIQFASKSDFADIGVVDLLTSSLNLVRKVPSMHGTVAAMCRSLHVLAASESDVDVSYSDPTVPFSVFVSFSGPTEGNRVERLAESIVHEALHLQLTLVEGIEPLVVESPSDALVFSPWKNEHRSVHGLMHGVYVFANLRCFWKQVATHLPEVSSFALTRIGVIDRELEAARQLEVSPLLTAMGRRLATSYLDIVI